ncbi:MAG: RNA polymerase sigma factor FliA [Legionella sp.]
MDTLADDSKVNQQAQETLLRLHEPLVKRIAYHLMTRLPSSIQFDDLLQAGMLGLLEAVRHYDEGKGAAFETYASIRIRGYMLDEVRRNDWVPRSVYRNARTISAAVKLVENRLGRDAKNHEVAEEIGVSLNEYHEMLSDSACAHICTFEELGVSDDTVVISHDPFGVASEPFTQALYSDMSTQLAQLMDNLPKNERLVLSLYYERDLNLKEIGEVLGVTESRVSQIHSQATHRLKSRLPEF